MSSQKLHGCSCCHPGQCNWAHTDTMSSVPGSLQWHEPGESPVSVPLHPLSQKTGAQVHSFLFSCRRIFVTRPGCSVWGYTWYPKRWSIRLQPLSSGKTLPGSPSWKSSPEGQSAAYKPLIFSLLLNSPKQIASLSYKLSQKRCRAWVQVSPLAMRVQPSWQVWTKSLPWAAPASFFKGKTPRKTWPSGWPVTHTLSSKCSAIFAKMKLLFSVPAQQRFQNVSNLFFPVRLSRLIFPRLHGLSKYLKKMRLLWSVIILLFK